MRAVPPEHLLLDKCAVLGVASVGRVVGEAYQASGKCASIDEIEDSRPKSELGGSTCNPLFNLFRAGDQGLLPCTTEGAPQLALDPTQSFFKRPKRVVPVNWGMSQGA